MTEIQLTNYILYEMFIKGHLNESIYTFREYFRLNYDQFSFILLLFKDDISLFLYYLVKNPITPEEKLAITLR